MAILASTALTLAEWATRLDPGGRPAAVIELLGQTNEMLTDMLWMECNDGGGHKTTVRTGLPNANGGLVAHTVVALHPQHVGQHLVGLAEQFDDRGRTPAGIETRGPLREGQGR